MKGIASLFSANVRRFRDLRGLTQAVLSERVGISINFLSQIEGGKKFPSDGVIDKFAEALQVPPHELFMDWEAGNDHGGSELAAKSFTKAFLNGLEMETSNYIQAFFRKK